MSFEIFKNADENILFTGGGNVLKRPYETGFMHDITITNNPGFSSKYIKCKSPISNINLEDFSIVLFLKYEARTANGGNFAFGSENYQNALGYYKDGNTGSQSYITYNKPSFSSYGTNYKYGFGGNYARKIAVLNFSPNQVELYKGGYNLSDFIVMATNTIEFTSEIYDYFYLGLSAKPQYSYQETRSSIGINRAIVFNRKLSFDECEFIYNNALFSDPLANSGLVLDVNLRNKAEILDFSNLQDGSDMRVGVRDYSGKNYHGEIMNLPAGTLQEQLDYANDNLFFSFIG